VPEASSRLEMASSALEAENACAMATTATRAPKKNITTVLMMNAHPDIPP